MEAAPLLSPPPPPEDSPVAGAVDFRGRPVSFSSSGGWRAALFVMALEVSEPFAWYGVAANLINYLTGVLGRSTAAAAAEVNVWTGTAAMLPLLGAVVADSSFGRYRTIVVACLVYFLGYGLLTLTSTLFPPSSSCGGSNSGDAGASTPPCEAPPIQAALLFTSLYLIALGQGTDKPCSLAFGADQFDPTDPPERAARASFFNWWYFSMAAGITTAVTVLSYVQDNVGWGIGFGIPWLMMSCSSLIFVLGSGRYRVFLPSGESPHARLWRDMRTFAHSKLASAGQSECEERGEKVKDVEQVEEFGQMLRVLPIWFTIIGYAVVFAQINTLFNKQAKTLDRRIGPAFVLPAAALQSVGTVAILLFVPAYDRLLVPAIRRATGHPGGLTMLQRIGVGLLISAMSIVSAAVVEVRRLEVAREAGLVDRPAATVPMTWAWMVPQYVLVGVADVFTNVGMNEFFYDQMPGALRSLGMGMSFAVLGIGNFLSGFLIAAIDGASRRISGESWFADNMNRAHLDYFYWLLAALSAVELVLFVCASRGYNYKKSPDSLQVLS